MKTIVCGGRDYNNYQNATKTLDTFGITFVIEGGATGADTLARVWAKNNGIPCATIDANWEYYGKSAGHKRNSWMLELNPDAVIAFPGGAGTSNMVMQAKARGIKVITCDDYGVINGL